MVGGLFALFFIILFVSHHIYFTSGKLIANVEFDTTAPPPKAAPQLATADKASLAPQQQLAPGASFQKGKKNRRR